MLTDPMSVTYNSAAKSLIRIYTSGSTARYRTADGEFEVEISNSPPKVEAWESHVRFDLSRVLPDATPADVFDPFRRVRNTVGLSYTFDATRAQTSVDVPLLRSALLATVDSTLQGRLIGGEK
jgi:hypothetical protein